MCGSNNLVMVGMFEVLWKTTSSLFWMVYRGRHLVVGKRRLSLQMIFFATTDDIWPSNDDDILDFKQTMLNGVKYWKTMFYCKMVDSQQADEGPQN